MIEEEPERPDRRRGIAYFEVGQLKMGSVREGVVHTVSLSGELDLATADAAESELERVEATDALSIILDLSGLTFIDSTGVRFLLSAHARSRADSNRLAMLRGPHAVQRIFELCAISDLLPFAESRSSTTCG